MIERRCPLDNRKKIGFGTAILIVLIVVLRVSVGWHFLFEGLWKMEPTNEFSAKGFLGMAKGPTKELYYIMLPDLNAVDRLTVAKAYTYDSQAKKKVPAGLTLPVIESQWYSYYDQYQKKYTLSDQQKVKTDAIVDQYVLSLREYTTEKVDDIKAYIASLDRNAAKVAASTNGAEHQKKRDWDNQMKLRKEGSTLIAEPEQMGVNMQMALWCELNAKQKANGELPVIAYGDNRIPFAGAISSTPFIKDFATPSRLGFLDLTVTVGLAAIGLFLMLGLCSRLAALAGAAFMFNVCLSQFPWPTVYPYSPEVVGHFMIFSKDSAELLVLLLLAAVPSGRWAGLDWFLWNFGGKQLMAIYGWKKDPLAPEGFVPDDIPSCKQNSSL